MDVRLRAEQVLIDGPNVNRALSFLSTSPRVSIPAAWVELALWLAARFGWKTRSNRQSATRLRLARGRPALKVAPYDHRAHQIGESDILAAWLIAVIVLLLLFAFG